MKEFAGSIRTASECVGIGVVRGVMIQIVIGIRTIGP